jgi:hypothetical protein
MYPTLAIARTVGVVVFSLRSRGTVEHRVHRDPQGVPAADHRSGQVTTITATPTAS